MKKIVITALMSIGGTIFGMERVTLPDAETLKQRLLDQRLSPRGLELLPLHEHFGDKSLSPSEISSEYDQQVSLYIAGQPEDKKDFLTHHLTYGKGAAMVALLQDHPDALQFVLEKKDK